MELLFARLFKACARKIDLKSKSVVNADLLKNMDFDTDDHTFWNKYLETLVGTDDGGWLIHSVLKLDNMKKTELTIEEATSLFDEIQALFDTGYPFLT